MTRSEWMPADLHALSRRWSNRFEQLAATPDRIAVVTEELPDLLHRRDVFARLLENIVKGRPYPDIRQTAMFETEILLYLDPRRYFSIRMFLYGPGDFTPIHDHNSWGLTGTVNGTLRVIKYRRHDDGSRPGKAAISLARERTMQCGETELTLPLDEGIHQTGNPQPEDPIIMVSVYGSPIRRLYVNGFDLERQRVFPLYAPRIKKKKLAADLYKML